MYPSTSTFVPPTTIPPVYIPSLSALRPSTNEQQPLLREPHEHAAPNPIPPPNDTEEDEDCSGSEDAASEPPQARLEFGFEPDHRPNKMAKQLLNTFSGNSTRKEVRELRVYQLACQSRNTFVARATYLRARCHEIRMMYAVAQAELEEAEAQVKGAQLQVESVQHDLCTSGGPFTKENIDKLAAANLPYTPELDKPIEEPYNPDNDGGRFASSSTSNISTVRA